MVEHFDSRDIVTHALESSPGLSSSQLTERRCQLTVMRGPGQEQVVEIDRFPFRVGKGADCELQIPDVTVSREHFVLEEEQGSFLLRDLGSTNGTWIEEMRVREAYLRPGATIKAGKVELRFEPIYKALELVAAETNRFGALVGRSMAMRQIFTLLDSVANTEATVIILGETGTGKGAVARTTHDSSKRKDKPFVVVDCGAIADNLIESELFGHDKGAFTGANKARQGALELAADGTLFIDELLDLRLDLQPKLLRALEEREFRRLGSHKSHRLDARIIAASKRDLWAEVEAGRFREDLYFRLAVFTIPLPPLRDRLEDISLLVARFADEMNIDASQRARLNRQMLAKLQQYDWPGNIRELRNAVERYLYFGELQLGPQRSQNSRPAGAAPSVVGQHVQQPAAAIQQGASSAAADAGLLDKKAPAAAMLKPQNNTQTQVQNKADDDDSLLRVNYALPYKKAKEALLEQFEQAYLMRLMPACKWQVSLAARTAGIDRKHLYNLLKKYAIRQNEGAD